MTSQPFLAAVATMCVLGGMLTFALGVPRLPVSGRPATNSRPALLAWLMGDRLPAQARRRHRQLLGAGVVLGMLMWLFSGWLLMVLVVPAALLGIPALLRPPTSATDVEQLNALEQWTRGLSGVLTVGGSLEHAILASLGSTPTRIRPQVNELVARLGARWPTERALRAFADELDDATGDLVVGALVLGSRKRGPGLAAVLEDLAATVAEEVRIRRTIEADRSKPRTTARWVTLITLGVLTLLFLNGSYVEPYRSGVGQLVFGLFLGLYVGCLLWMRRMTVGQPTPRFLPASAKD